MTLYPYIQVLFISTIILSGAMVHATWRNLSASHVVSLWFTRLMFVLSAWLFCYMLELAETNIDVKILWTKLKFVAVALTPAIWLFFCTFTTSEGTLIPRRTRWYLVGLPILTGIIVMTDGFHHLFWQTLVPDQNGDLFTLKAVYNFWFWVHAAYSYVLLAAGAFYLIRYLLKSPTMLKGRVIILLAGVAVPWIANVVTLTGISPVDLTPLCFIFTSSLLAWGILRFHLMNVIPIARDTLFDQLIDPAIIVDMKLDLLEVNDAARVWLKKDQQTDQKQSIGQPLSAIFPALKNDQSWHATARQLGYATREWVIEANTRPNQPLDRVFDVRISVLKDRNQVSVGFLLVLRDITEQKQNEAKITLQNRTLVETNSALASARERAEESSRLKGEFLSIVSHELRTPLNAIMGFTELQLMGAIGDVSTEQNEYLKRTMSSSTELLGMIDTVLDLTQLEADRLTLRNEPTVVADWWDGTVEKTRRAAIEKKLAFDAYIDPTLPTLFMGDAQRLQQVLGTLLGNALKFTEAGQIKVWLRRLSADQWEMGVQDSGIGIPEPLQDVIFEAFRQVDGSSQRKYGGVGVGLALAQRLVVLMGGEILLESEPDKGSTFRVILPLKTEALAEMGV